MNKDAECFDEAILCVSRQLRDALERLDTGLKEQTYEIRLRSNRPVMFFGAYGNAFFGRNAVLSSKLNEDTYLLSMSELTDTFNRLCGYSIHAHQNSINGGFVPMRGGHRAGIAGTAVCGSKGEIVSVRDISSVNIRIAREVNGCADELAERFYSDGLSSLIIAGPPASGKTTVLRDLVRQLSGGGTRCYKTAVVDEREEIAAVYEGLASRDIGYSSDVLNCYPKNRAITFATRTMSPQIIACDEICTQEEVEAIRQGVNTGVRFIVTVHASNFDELVTRSQIAGLLETYSFDNVVLLSAETPGKIEEIYGTGELRDEIYIRRSGFFGVERSRDYDKLPPEKKKTAS